MKAIRILFACPILLLLGGCLDPIPFDQPGYGRNNSLRYPPNYTRSPGEYPRNPAYDNRRDPYEGNRWERPSGSSYPGPPHSEGFPTDPLPQPQRDPRPKPPEANPLVEIDPIEEADKPKYDYAIPVQGGASNLVVSPYAKEGPYIDVSGLSSGTQIECPKTKKTILVP